MFNVRDIFFFDEMLTLKVITILILAGALYVAVTGLSVMFAGDKMTFPNSPAVWVSWWVA